MTKWSDEELRRVGEAQELRLASARRDGTMRPYVTMWVVGVGDDLYVRSAYGPNNPWFRRAKASGAGRTGPVVWSWTSPSPRQPQACTPASTPPTTPSTTATAPRS
jgi:hypothetical protein